MGMHAWSAADLDPKVASCRGTKFDHAVVKVGGGICKRLPNVFVLEFWILGSKLIAIRIGGQGF
jgi:hypothetical protein